MSHIKSIHIEGFKKFSNIDISFDPHMNILVGENEAGKSTILEAIRIVLNQQYRNADKSVLSDLFNAENVTAFKANPSIYRAACGLEAGSGVHERRKVVLAHPPAEILGPSAHQL